MPFDPDAFEQAKRNNLSTAQQVQGTSAGENSELDFTGRLKERIVSSMDPEKRSAFGETTLPGELVKKAAEFFLPSSNVEAGITLVLGAAAKPILTGLKSGAKLGMDISAKMVPQTIKKMAVEGFGELFRPGVLREGGVEVAAHKMGLVGDSLARATGKTAAATAYDDAAKVVGRIDPTNMITDAIAEFAAQSNPSKVALKYITNMKDKFVASGSGITYDRMLKELNGLRNAAEGAFTRGDNVAGKTFYELRAKALDALDNISPAVRNANALYRIEESAKDVISVLRRPSSGSKMRELFENNPLVSGSFKSAGPELYRIADKVGSMASEAPMGLGNRILGAMNNLTEGVIKDDKLRAAFERILDTTAPAQLPSVLGALGKATRQVVREATSRGITGTPGQRAVTQTGRAVIARTQEE